MTNPSEFSPYSLTEAALLRGSDDLLADFDRAYHVFQSLVNSCHRLQHPAAPGTAAQSLPGSPLEL